MNINLDYIPGDYAWVMLENEPVQLVVNSIDINVSLDYSKDKIVIGASYNLSNGRLGGKFSIKQMCHTKDELKEKIFG